MSIAFTFPGQGSQGVGMGKELADRFPEARAVFEEVDAALGQRLSDVMWNGPADELTLTANAQPALMAVSLATIRVAEARGLDLAGSVAFVAGHSLGEYSALAAAGALSIGDAARLLRTRGTAMQQAVPVGEGAMAAVLGLDLAAVRKLVAEAAEGEVLAAANDNDPAQVVISGAKAAVERAAALAKEAGAKRALMLPVSAPFHCALMAPAARVMAEALDDVHIAAPAVPLVANVTADRVTDEATIRSLLVEQVCGAVRWRESVAFMVGQGVTEFWEIGAGKALSGMVRRIHKEASVQAVGTAADVTAAARSLTA